MFFCIHCTTQAPQKSVDCGLFFSLVAVMLNDWECVWITLIEKCNLTFWVFEFNHVPSYLKWNIPLFVEIWMLSISFVLDIQKISLMSTAFKWMTNLVSSPSTHWKWSDGKWLKVTGLQSCVLTIFSLLQCSMSHISGWRNTERIFNGSYRSKSGCADQYIYMVWEGEWNLAKQKHDLVAFGAAINPGAPGDQFPNAFLIWFCGVRKAPWCIRR